jgi:hypothetical protein
MKRTLVRFRNSKFRQFVKKHEKYALLLFFVGGFVFDTLTLGRIDRLYDIFILCFHMTALSAALFVYNMVEDHCWKHPWLLKWKSYLPLAIQFFFGALSSAYVIYFSRSVSFSKTFTFFLILLGLLVANEFLKQRISNKYLHFGIYSFVSVTFFTFMIPVLVKETSVTIFVYSSLGSLLLTLLLASSILMFAKKSREKIKIWKLYSVIFAVYGVIHLFYFLRLIPPVPLSLSEGIVAYSVQQQNNQYLVTYEPEDWYYFWRSHRKTFHKKPAESVYIFSSVFAPTDLEEKIRHRWMYYDANTKEWQVTDDVSYEILGGRDEGYRGYTYKQNVIDGDWRVEVITEEELVLGVISFTIETASDTGNRKLKTKKF